MAAFSILLQDLNPSAYWQLDEAQGLIAEDTMNQFDGQYMNQVTLDEPGALVNDPSTAASFDGIDDYIEIAHDDAFELSRGSLQFWFNPNSVEGVQGLFSKDSTDLDNGGHFTVLLDNGRIFVRAQSAESDQLLLPEENGVTANQWHQVVTTWSEAGLYLYLDGQLIISETNWTTGWQGNQEPIILGANQWLSNDLVADNLIDFFNGRLDEVALFDRPLTPTEVANLYNVAKGDIDEDSLDNSGDTDESDAPDGNPDQNDNGVDVTDSNTTDSDPGDVDGSGSTDTENTPGASDNGSTDDSGDTPIDSGTDFSSDAGAPPTSDSASNDLDDKFTRSVNPETESQDDTRNSRHEVIYGTPNDDLMRGRGGDDIIYGLASDDLLAGNRGNDQVHGNAGEDELRGFRGRDQLLGGKGQDRLKGGRFNDVLRGGQDNDVLSGGKGHDTLRGGADDDRLRGNSGNDKLAGGRGDDVLLGGRGSDKLVGGSGDDLLSGRAGNDVLRGGRGADIFALGVDHGFDRVKDFTHGVDQIKVVSASFSDLTLTQSGRNTLISVGNQDIALLLGINTDAIAPSDFI